MPTSVEAPGGAASDIRRVANAVVTRPGRCQKVADNLEVKEVTVGDGERRRRYVVCYNPDEAERQRRHRAQVLEELTAEIESLAEQRGTTHAKRVCELRASGRYGRYVRLTKTGQLRIPRDGEHGFHGNVNGDSRAT
jgi:hypothetical protein